MRLPEPSKIEPLDHCVLVRLIDIERVSPGGVLLPDSSVDREQFATQHAEVLKVGANAGDEWGAERARLTAGANVVLKRYEGATDISTDKLVKLVNDSDILAVIE